MAAKRSLGRERREARCGASGERRDTPEGPFCPTEGRVLLHRGVVALRYRGPDWLIRMPG